MIEALGRPVILVPSAGASGWAHAQLLLLRRVADEKGGGVLR